MSEERAEGPQPAPATSVLRLRGLPFQATEADVVEFFADVPLEQIVLCRRNGGSRGSRGARTRSTTGAAPPRRVGLPPRRRAPRAAGAAAPPRRLTPPVC